MSTETHFYEPAAGHRLRHDPFNAIVGPRPIGWISTVSKDDVLNLAPYSFFNAFSYHPHIIGFASLGRKDTLCNIERTGEFVWNLATRSLADAMNTTCAEVESSISEFALSGLTPAPSQLVAAPRVGESPVSFECKCTQIVRLVDLAGTSIPTWLILGEVVGVHISKGLLVDGIYRTETARPILRAGGTGDYFEISENGRFTMERPRVDRPLSPV
jgi:flavin reductase (DIM6/NTAB) family NADH-FMN oxidoreductase RutF